MIFEEGGRMIFEEEGEWFFKKGEGINFDERKWFLKRGGTFLNSGRRMIFGERGGMIFEYPCIINILYLRRNVSSWIPRLGYSLRCCLPCRCRGNPRRSSRALPPPRSSSPPSSSSASTTLEAPGHCRYQFLINKIWIIVLIRGPALTSFTR